MHSLRLGVLPLLPLASAVAGAALLAATAFGARADDAPQGFIEEVRVVAVDGYVVQRHIFFEPGTPDIGAIADELAGDDGVAPGGVTAQFVVNPHIWAAASLPVTVSYNPDGQPAGIPAANLISNALAEWNSVSPGSFSFVNSGDGSGDTGVCGSSPQRDGVNTIRFVSYLRLGVLGQTCTIWPSGGGPDAPLVEFDMEMDDDTPWGFGDQIGKTQFDLASTTLHEIGHAAGIGHSSQSSAVMFASLAPGTQKRTLTADDRDAILAAYPGVPTPTPSATFTPAPTQTPVPPPPDYNKNFDVKAPALARD